MLRVGLNVKELVEDLHQSTPSELLSVRLFFPDLGNFFLVSNPWILNRPPLFTRFV